MIWEEGKGGKYRGDESYFLSSSIDLSNVHSHIAYFCLASRNRREGKREERKRMGKREIINNLLRFVLLLHFTILVIPLLFRSTPLLSSCTASVRLARYLSSVCFPLPLMRVIRIYLLSSLCTHTSKQSAPEKEGEGRGVGELTL